jgi:hypothetical protein
MLKTHEIDVLSFLVSYTVISTPCATMYVRTTSRTVSRYYETATSTAQTLGRRCRRSQRETPQRHRKTC